MPAIKQYILLSAVIVAFSTLAGRDADASDPSAETAPRAGEVSASLPPEVPDPQNRGDQPAPARAVDAIAEAHRLEAEGKNVQAWQAYERADRFAPAHPAIQRELGLACYRTDRTGRAMAHLLRAAQTDSDDLPLQVVLGRLYQADHQPVAAMRAYRTALKCSAAAPDSALAAEALLALSGLLESTGQLQPAADALDVLVGWLDQYGQSYSDPLARLEVSVPSDLLVRRAALALRLDRPRQAVAFYQDAGLLDAPLQGRERSVLVAALAGDGRVDEAAQRLAGDDDLAGAALIVLNAYADADRLRDGAAWAAAWIARRPDVGERLGGILEQVASRRPADEVRAAETVDAPPDAPAVVDYVRACLAAGRGDRAAARDGLERAVTTDPSFRIAQRKLAEIALDQGDVERADAIAQALSEDENAKSLVAYLLGRIELAQGNLDAAVEALTQVVADRPDFQDAALALAEGLNRNAQPHRALEALRSTSAQSDAPERDVLGATLELTVRAGTGALDEFVQTLQQAREDRRMSVEADTLALDITCAQGLWLIGKARSAAELTDALARRYPDVMDVQLLAAQADLLTEIAGLAPVAPAQTQGDVDDDIAAELARHIWAYHVRQLTLKPRMFGIPLLADAGRAGPQTLEQTLVKLKALEDRWPDRAPIAATIAEVLTAMDRPDQALEQWQVATALAPDDSAASWGCAVTLCRVRRPVEAAEIIVRLSIAYPREPALCEAALAPLVAARRYDDAIERAKEWLARNEAAADPISPWQIQARLAGLYQLAGYYDRCHQLLDEMLADAREPDDRRRVICQKLAAFIAAGDPQSAREFYRRTSPDAPDPPDAAVVRGVMILLMMENDQIDAALGVLDDALAAADGDDGLQFDLRASQIAVCADAKQYDRALAMLEEWTADEAHPYHSAYEVLRITVEAAAERLDDAVARLRDSGDRLVRLRLIGELITVERFDDVRQLGAAWAQQTPTDQRLLTACVDVLQEADRTDTALALLADWDAALGAPPEAGAVPVVTADATIQARRAVGDTRALVLLLADRLDEAADAAARAVDEDPNSVQLRLRYATVLDRQQRRDEAIQQLTVAADAVREPSFLTEALPPEQPAEDSDGLTGEEELHQRRQWKAAVLNNLGYIYVDQGIQLDEAEAMIAESLTIQQTVSSLDSLAWAYYKQGQFDRAWEVFERIVAPDPDRPGTGARDGDSVICDHAGDVLFRLGRVDAAIALWRKAIDLADPAEISWEIQQILDRTPTKIIAAENGQTPPVAPLGEGVDDPFAPSPSAPTETTDS